MSKTSLQIVNSILIRLREDEVTTFADPYTKVILEFINDTLDDMQTRNKWRSNTGTTSFVTVAGQRTYDLTSLLSATGDVAAGSTVMVKDSSLTYHSGITYRDRDPMGVHGQQNVNAFDTTDSPVVYQLRLLGDDRQANWIWNRLGRDSNAVSTPLTDFWLSIDQQTDVLKFNYTDDPGTGRTVELHAYNPQADLTTISDIVYVPHRPLILGAYAKALEERGEELGPNGQLAELRYQRALDEAILVDMGDIEEIAIPE